MSTESTEQKSIHIVLDEKNPSFSSDVILEKDLEVTIKSERICFSHHTFKKGEDMDLLGFPCFALVDCKIKGDLILDEVTRFIILKNTVVKGRIRSSRDVILVMDSESRIAINGEEGKNSFIVSHDLGNTIIRELNEIAERDFKLLQNPEHPFIVQELPKTLTDLSTDN